MSKSNEQLSDELLARYIAHSATGEEKEIVENWLSQFPERKQELEQVKLIWKHSAAIGKSKGKGSKVDRAWIQMQEKMQKNAQDADQPDGSSQGTAGLRNGSGRKWYPFMALVLGVAAALIMIFRFNYDQSQEPVKMLRLATANSSKIVELPDGSQVFLNHHSSLDYPEEWTEGFRTVSLKGEAFFEVASDSSRPFIIQTGEGEIKVLGTSFNVRAQEATPLRVDVVSGKVQLKTSSTKKVLIKGQGAEVHADTIQSLVANANMISYKTQIYDFNASQLGEVVEQIRNGYHADVRLAKSQLSNCRLTLRLEKEPLDTTLAVIAETLQLSLRKEGETYWLEGPGCR
ncbi:FecR family protein [Dyadobacter tibetensis]|uniref:FecR family protein n=1 Tax=Dyadobacter tibetensis TaxID=1211851 RepID=UPI000470F052|nr:FecR domain-containing protein [Dyadobacter tibetensis]